MGENDSNVSNITQWLANLRKGEAEQSAHVSAIIKKHLSGADLPFKKCGEIDSWSSCGWELYLNIDALLRDGNHSDVLKAMFAEIVDFCEISTSESFDYKLKILFEKFIESDSQQSKLAPLLPTKAVARFDEIRRMMREEHEEYMERLDQMYY